MLSLLAAWVAVAVLQRVAAENLVVTAVHWTATQDGSDSLTVPVKMTLIDSDSGAPLSAPAAISSSRCGLSVGEPLSSSSYRDAYTMTAQAGDGQYLLQWCYANQNALEATPASVFAVSSRFFTANTAPLEWQKGTSSAPSKVALAMNKSSDTLAYFGEFATGSQLVSFQVNSPTQTTGVTTTGVLPRFISLFRPWSTAKQFYFSTLVGSSTSPAIMEVSGSGAVTEYVHMGSGYSPYSFVFVGGDAVWVVDDADTWNARGNLLMWTKSGSGVWTCCKYQVLINTQFPIYTLASTLLGDSSYVDVGADNRRGYKLFMATRFTVHSYDPASGKIDDVWVQPEARFQFFKGSSGTWSGELSLIRGLTLAPTVLTLNSPSPTPSVTPSPSASPALGMAPVTAVTANVTQRWANGSVLVLFMAGQTSYSLATASNPASITSWTAGLAVYASGSAATPTGTYYYNASGVNAVLDSLTTGLMPSISADGRYLVFPAYQRPPGSVDPSTQASGPVQRLVARVPAANASAIDASTLLPSGIFSAMPITAAASIDGRYHYAAGGIPGTIVNGANADGAFAIQHGGGSAVMVAGPSTTGSGVTGLAIFNNTLYGSSSRVGYQGIVQVSQVRGRYPWSPPQRKERRHLYLDRVFLAADIAGAPTFPAPNTRPAHAFCMESEDVVYLGFLFSPAAVGLNYSEIHRYERTMMPSGIDSVPQPVWRYARPYARGPTRVLAPAAPISMAGRPEGGSFIIYAVYSPATPLAGGLSAESTVWRLDTAAAGNSFTKWLTYLTTGSAMTQRQIRGIALAPVDWSQYWAAGAVEPDPPAASASVTPSPSTSAVPALSPTPSVSTLPSATVSASASRSPSSSVTATASPSASPSPAASASALARPANTTIASLCDGTTALAASRSYLSTIAGNAALVRGALGRCPPLRSALAVYGLALRFLAQNGSSAPWARLRDVGGAVDPHSATATFLQRLGDGVSGAAGAASERCWRPNRNSSALSDDLSVAATVASNTAASIASVGSLPGDLCALSCSGHMQARLSTSMISLVGLGSADDVWSGVSLPAPHVGYGPMVWLCDMDGSWVPAHLRNASAAGQATGARSASEVVAGALPFSPLLLDLVSAFNSTASTPADTAIAAAVRISPLCSLRIANASQLLNATLWPVISASNAARDNVALAAVASPWGSVTNLPPPLCLPAVPQPAPASSVGVCSGSTAVLSAGPAALLPWSANVSALPLWHASAVDASVQLQAASSVAELPAGAYSAVLVAAVPSAVLSPSGNCSLRFSATLTASFNTSLTASLAAVSSAGGASSGSTPAPLAILPLTLLLPETRAVRLSQQLSLRFNLTTALVDLRAALRSAYVGAAGSELDASSMVACGSQITTYVVVAATGGSQADVQVLNAQLLVAPPSLGTASASGVPLVPLFAAVASPALPLLTGADVQLQSGAGTSASPSVFTQCARAAGVLQPPTLPSNATIAGGDVGVGAVGVWADALPLASSSVATPVKRLVVSELLRPAEFSVQLLDVPLADETVTVSCSVTDAAGAGLVVSPAPQTLRAADFVPASGATAIFRVYVRAAPAFNSSLLAPLSATGAANTGAAVEALSCRVVGTLPGSAPAAGRQPAYSSAAPSITAEVVYLRSAAPFLLDTVTEIALAGTSSGLNTTLLRAAWGGAESAAEVLSDGSASSPASLSEAFGGSATALQTAARIASLVGRTNPVVAGGRAGSDKLWSQLVSVPNSATARLAFNVLVTGAVNVTLVAQAALYSRTYSSPMASGASAAAASAAPVGPFSAGMVVKVGSVPCPVSWVSADGMMARIRAPSTAALCPALAAALARGQATGRDCGYQPLAITIPGLPLSAVTSIAAATSLSAVTLGQSATLAPAVTLSCPPFCAGAGLGLVPIPVAAAAADGSDGTAFAASTWQAAQSASTPADAAPLRASFTAQGGLFYSESCSATGVYTDPATGACLNTSDPRSQLCAFGAGDYCQQCPQHALCPGGWRARPLQSYWSASERSTDIALCPPPSATRCKGYSDALGSVECGASYRAGSPLCQACAQGFYEQLDTTCTACPPAQNLADVLLPIVKFLGGLAGVATLMFAAIFIATKRNGGTVVGGAMRTLQFTLSVVSVLQVFVQVGRAASPGLPPFFRAFIGAISVFVFDGIALPPACLPGGNRFSTEIIEFGLVLALEGALALLQLNYRRLCFGCLLCGAGRGARAEQQPISSDASAGKPGAEDGTDPVPSKATPADASSPAQPSDASARRSPRGKPGVDHLSDKQRTAKQLAALQQVVGKQSTAAAAPAGKQRRAVVVGVAADRIKPLLRRTIFILLTLLYATVSVSCIKMLSCTSVSLPLRSFMQLDHAPLEASATLSSAGISAAAANYAAQACADDPLSAACAGDGVSAASSGSVLLEEPVRVRVLTSDTYQVCFEGSHTLAGALGIAAFLLYVVGYPLGSAVLVWRRSRQLMRRSPYGQAWELAVKHDASRQAAYVLASRNPLLRVLRRCCTWVCCAGKRYSGLGPTKPGSRSAALLRCLQLECFLLCWRRSATDAGDMSRRGRKPQRAGSGKPLKIGAPSGVVPRRRQPRMSEVLTMAHNPLAAPSAAAGGTQGAAPRPSTHAPGAGDQAATGPEAEAGQQTAALLCVPLPPPLLQELQLEARAWRGYEATLKLSKAPTSPGHHGSGSSSSVSWMELLLRAANATTPSGAPSLPRTGSGTSADAFAARSAPDNAGARPTKLSESVAGTAARCIARVPGFSAEAAADQAAVILQLHLPIARVLTAADIMNTAPEVTGEGSLAPFLGGDFRAALWGFKHGDMALLFVLGLMLVLYRAPATSAEAATRLSITVLALAALLGYYVARRPYRSEVAYNHPVRVYSLLLAMLTAVLNYACFVTSVSGSTSGADAGSSNDSNSSAASPVLVLVLSWAAFLAAIGLLITLLVSFWIALLQGAAAEQQRLEATARLHAGRRIVLPTTPASRVSGAGKSAVAPDPPAAAVGASRDALKSLDAGKAECSASSRIIEPSPRRRHAFGPATARASIHRIATGGRGSIAALTPSTFADVLSAGNEASIGSEGGAGVHQQSAVNPLFGARGRADS